MCGFLGIVGRRPCAADLLVGLQALQHRGQDSAGVGTISDGQFPVVKKLGLVGQGFGPDELALLPGTIGIGHVRYPTIGRGVLRDAQPFFFRQPGVLMAHNGNFVNMREMEQELAEDSVHLMSRCDVEPVLCLFSLELMKRRRKDHTTADALAALEATCHKARGAFSLVTALILDGQETLLAVRGPRGIRPAVWGTRADCAIAASESVALDALSARCHGSVAPGEVLVLRANEPPQRHQLWTAPAAPCIFEFIYFARPDSAMNGHSVYGVRMALGRELGRAWSAKGFQADVVIPIPDTSRPAAAALAEALELPYREGFIKNRYTGRTFIMPTAGERASTLKLKLNPIRSEFAGRRVLVVDDSIVRGTTLAHTIQLIRDQGPTEVHLAIYSPPVLHPCYYGIDMSTREELAAPRFVPQLGERSPTVEEQAEVETRFAARLGLDSLTYLPLSGLRSAYPAGCCAACFDGDYPLPIRDEERRWIEEDRRIGVQRELAL